MNRYLIGLFIAVVVFAGWQLKRSGELQAVNRQYESSIDDMRTALLDQHQRQQKTDRLLAMSRRDNQDVRRRATELEYDLQQQASECINAVISDDTVNRVLEFQAGNQ